MDFDRRNINARLLKESKKLSMHCLNLPNRKLFQTIRCKSHDEEAHSNFTRIGCFRSCDTAEVVNDNARPGRRWSSEHGGQVDDMTMALIDSANDRTEEGQEQISQALFDLGKHKPALVLSCCYSYLKKHTKLAQEHRVILLQCMERIVKETLDQIDTGLATDLIKLGAQEMTCSKVCII
ncbi:maestro heat-like repeat-containing protein family member 1 [Saccostrea cucullata]|uniref:maestro heat-like repeat-containing protein family member 1 n=1 Tax=Saccostrea cuccullata TaxID=36930 RepID=UPI002ED0BF67